MSLDKYGKMRNFSKTPEPASSEQIQTDAGELIFVVQKHDATRLHYDLRLEFGGSFKSWAVPRGPSLNPTDQRLAVHVEDHPLSYGQFEGLIPSGNYGAGTVMLWDVGTVRARSLVDKNGTREEHIAQFKEGYAKGRITFVLSGNKLKGEFALIQNLNPPDQSNQWLLIKKQDSFVSYEDIESKNYSVITGRDMNSIAEQAKKQNQFWHSQANHAEQPIKFVDFGHFYNDTGKNRKPSKISYEVSSPGHASLDQSKSELFPINFSKKTEPAVIRQIDSYQEEQFSQNWTYSPQPFDEKAKRAIIFINPTRKQIKIYSKAGLEFTKKSPEIIAELKSFFTKGEALILDGYIDRSSADHDEDSKPNNLFRKLYVYDVLHCGGKNIRRCQFTVRLDLLKRLFDGLTGDHVTLVPAFEKIDQTNTKNVFIRHALAPYPTKEAKTWLTVSNPTISQDEAQDNQTSRPNLTNLNKIYWPQEKLTKGSLINYYQAMAALIVPHIYGHPLSLHRHPEGINEESFFQKNLVGYVPNFVDTINITARGSQKTISYPLCQNKYSLLYYANLGCIEINPWMSTTSNLDEPRYCVIDLDPDDSNTFDQVREICLVITKILDELALIYCVKTSGATGIHICIPLCRGYSFDQSRSFALAVCDPIEKRFPDICSLERSPSKRRGKIYLDCFQNARGQTLASVYSVRPRPGATVSTPLTQPELEDSKITPETFTIENVPKRISRLGDLWSPVLHGGNLLPQFDTKVAEP